MKQPVKDLCGVREISICTTQNQSGILGYGCVYACVCNKSQTKCVTFFLRIKVIHETQNKKSDMS